MSEYVATAHGGSWKTTWRSWFVHSATWVLESNSGGQAWQQMSLRTELSHLMPFRTRLPQTFKYDAPCQKDHLEPAGQIHSSGREEFMNLSGKKVVSSVSTVVCVGTYQFWRDALLGRSAHLRDTCLHLCFDVALLSSGKTDPGDALWDKSLFVHPCIYSILHVSYMPGVPGVGYRDKHKVKSWLSWIYQHCFPVRRKYQFRQKQGL